MKNQLRTILTAWKETPFARLRASDHCSFGYDRLTEQIAAATEYTVLHGPYRGMRYFGPPGVPVETHDAFDSRVTSRLVSRFSGTHRIEFVSAVARDPKRYSLLNAFPEATARMALDEGRTFTKEGKPQRWALLSPYVA